MQNFGSEVVVKTTKRLGIWLAAIAMAFTMVVASVSSAQADPGTDKAHSKGTWSKGTQAEKPSVTPNDKKVMADQLQPKGSSQFVKTNKQGVPQVSTPKAGNVTSVDFKDPDNFCSNDWVYTPVKNNSDTTKYIHIKLHLTDGGGYRDFYTSVQGDSTTYPYFEGVEGSYTATMFVWNGSAYVYDEYIDNVNNCDVSIKVQKTAVKGTVRLVIKNNGNAYASVQSQEWAPNSYGSEYDYPEVGGETLYRYYVVGTKSKYVITADLSNNSDENVPEDNGDYTSDSVVFNHKYSNTPA